MLEILNTGKHHFRDLGIDGSIKIDLQVIEVKLSRCLTKHHAIKEYWGSGDIAPRIFDLGTRWRRVVSFTPRPLYPHGNNLPYPVGSRAGLNAVVKRKIPSPCRDSNLRSSSP
jgi:hypothetical protein